MSDRDYQAARKQDDEIPLENKQNIALRKLLYQLADLDEEEQDDCGLIEAALRVADRIDSLEDEMDELREQVESQGQVVDMLGDIEQTKTTKEQKVATIVRFADQKRDDDNDVMRVVPQEIRGLLDVSRRYSYDLVDDIAQANEWARIRDGYTQASAKNGGGRRRVKKALELDFAGVHGEAVPVNKFTTDIAVEGGTA
jgi:hypothetical protein